MWKFTKMMFWLFCLVEVFAVNIYFRRVWPKELNQAANNKCEVVAKQNSECYNQVFTAQQQVQDCKEHIRELNNATINDALRTYDPPKICPKPKIIYKILHQDDPNYQSPDPEDPNDLVPDEDGESK